MFFVGSSFRVTHDPGFRTISITDKTFAEAITHPEKSKVFTSPADYGRTIFVISQYTLASLMIKTTTTKVGCIHLRASLSFVAPSVLRF
jgi:hypothetical protein